MDTVGLKLCKACDRPMSGRSDKLYHPRCAERVRKQRYRARLNAAGLTTRQTFKDRTLQEATG